jgi:hypothetical protein
LSKFSAGLRHHRKSTELAGVKQLTGYKQCIGAAYNKASLSEYTYSREASEELIQKLIQKIGVTLSP